MREARQKRQALATKDANVRAAAPKKRRKKKKKKDPPPACRAAAATSTSSRRRVLKFKDRPAAVGVGSGHAPPPPPPRRATLLAAAHATAPAVVDRLHGSRSAPELRPRTRASSKAMGIPGSIAPRSGGRSSSTSALVRRPSDPSARLWTAGEAQFARRNMWYAVLTQAESATRPSGVGLPSGRTPTVGAGGVGAARGEFAHFQHCAGAGADDGDLTPRPRFVERLKKKTAPRLRSDLMFQRDAGIARAPGGRGSGLAYRTRILAPID